MSVYWPWDPSQCITTERKMLNSPLPNYPLSVPHLVITLSLVVQVGYTGPMLRRGCGVSSVEIFQSQVNMVLDTLLWVSLLEQGLDLVTSRGLFKLQPFFDSRQTMFCYSATFATFLHKTRHMCLILCENTSPPPQILGTWVIPLGLTSDFSFKGQMNEEVGIDVQLVSLHTVN